MSDLLLLPDIEALLKNFLLDQDEVTAFFATGLDMADGNPITDPPLDRVYSVMPNTKIFPLVRISSFGGVPRTRKPRYTGAPRVQLDGFAHRRDVARALVETCAAVIAARITGVHDEGIVSGADVDEPFTGDSAFPKLQMKSVTATIYTHPGPLAGS